ncbi:hypothetical protein KZ829_36670 [Actinoplanes hulinensis]|uniref:T3SS peptide-binding chaperone domain-containing protein n=1 Tax=Actinoplanes hulinensis TaxID=1144547 RepID=A0ABS7BEF6_9ACTN|nr:hypothetical protein [Actinoplanes hulinensis]MBW6439261.1 hypothetical protein [Actinoplanes hulinensis]MBW6439272.1 hypothetical protein [Actinoplanes hulinensis]
MSEDPIHLSFGYRHALSWWLAAEMVRRHSSLSVRQYDDVSGFMFVDVLNLERPDGSCCVYISRHKKPKIFVERAGGGTRVWPLHQLLLQSGYLLIQKIESEAGLPSRPLAKAMNTQALVYRVAAEVALATAHRDDPIWAGDARFDLTKLSGFPLIPSDPPWGQCWLLGENAAVDMDGFAYVGRSRYDLPTVYARANENLQRTMATVFHPIL